MTRLGKYELIAKLGEGTYAEVWKAQDVTLERTVALKLLKPVWMMDAEARQRFLHEARVLANLQHPRIAWVWDLGDEEGRAYIAMRFVDGPSLEKVIRDYGRLDWKVALRIAVEAAEGLAFAHQKGAVHCDVKPGNILLSKEEGVVLADFGLVKALEGSAAATHSSVMLGTPAYLAPEVWSGQAASPASDQYALACTLVEMLTGSPLFTAPNAPAIMQRHFQPLELPPLPAGLPPALRTSLYRALAKEPGQRYASIEELRQALLVAQRNPAVQAAAMPGPAPAVQPAAHEMVVKLALGVEMVLVRIPAGEFLYGEKKWKVHLDEYWMGKYPVTNAQFRAFLRESKYPYTERLPEDKDDHPVTNVDFFDVTGFCAWAADACGHPVQLPTEAQWEKAARGTDGRTYPWGEQEPDKKLCNFNNHFKSTTPVGHFSPQSDSPYGCADMAGNVWEWVMDWYDPDYLDQNPGPEPKGSPFGASRILRGGAWYYASRYLHSSNRVWYDPGYRNANFGFRCAR